MEYIYKMTKLVSLSEMTTKMQTFYPNATYLAADSPTIQQMESSTTESSLHCDQPNLNTNSSKQCGNLIIVITHVTPYIEMARNQFEKNVGVQQFVYEQRLDSKIAQSVAEQYKKRVILTAGHSFPYFLKRIPVISKKEVILDPIDVAIDEMQERVRNGFLENSIEIPVPKMGLIDRPLPLENDEIDQYANQKALKKEPKES